MAGLRFYDRLHFLHRAWRYRLRSERSELAYMRSRDLRGRTCVDVGAHRGLYSYWMHKAVGPSGRVVAFEPQPEMLEELKKMKHTFGIGNLTIVERGVSSAPGTTVLRRFGNDTGGASVEHDAAAGGTAIPIQLTSLDDYFAANPLGPVAFIKCDVEGHEREVFRGARRILSHDRPALLFECQDRHALEEGGVFEDLKGLGYRGWFLDGTRRVPVERLKEERGTIHRPYLNYVFEPVA